MRDRGMRREQGRGAGERDGRKSILAYKRGKR